MADSAAGDTAGDQALGEAGRESPVVDTGECLGVFDWFFCRAYLTSLCLFRQAS